MAVLTLITFYFWIQFKITELVLPFYLALFVPFKLVDILQFLLLNNVHYQKYYFSRKLFITEKTFGKKPENVNLISHNLSYN